MADDLLSAMKVSAAGMKAQGTRLRISTENVANAQSTGETPGAEPYRRQTIAFKARLDKALGAQMVEVDSIGKDTKTPFELKFLPDHPAADEQGYVKMPNVNALVEIMDVREAQRSYEANLGMIEQARSMVLRTIDMLRG
ncbi:MAG: flagellar basal body rod protein FlgC [Alphaproteobacteria bacterium]|nr:flagellar basal body rod protein FlgC [Alphaproteobacteria bacterium]